MTTALDRTETQYAVQISYRGTDHVDLFRSQTRNQAESAAARARAPWPIRPRSVSTAVERTPTPWKRHNDGDALPQLAEGERLGWGVLYTWADSHTEVRPRPNRADAESTLRLAEYRPEPLVRLVVRVLPAWAPVGGSS